MPEVFTWSVSVFECFQLDFPFDNGVLEVRGASVGLRDGRGVRNSIASARPVCRGGLKSATVSRTMFNRSN